MSPIPSHGLFPEPSGLGVSGFEGDSGSPHPPISYGDLQAVLKPDMEWARGLRVALVHDWLNGMRGGEKVLELLAELFPAAPIYTLFLERQKLSPLLASRVIKESWLGRFPGARRRYRHLLPLMPWAVEGLPLGEYDLIVSTSHCVAHGARGGRNTVHISYCHTPMRYIWDKYEDYFGAGKASLPVRLAMGLLRPWLQRKDLQFSKRVDGYLSNGVAVAGRIERTYGHEAVAVGAPVDLETFRGARLRAQAEGRARQGPYLVLSALEPYKRIDLCVEAFRRLGPDYPLVVAGSGSLGERLRREAPDHVTFLGWVADEKLPDLLASSRALVFPADEDFGIVPLEAAAAGVPTVCYASGGSLETVVEGVTGTGFLVQNPEEIAQAVERVSRLEFDSLAMEAHAARYARPLVSQRLAREIRRAYERKRPT
jgi:glycosyltransferase involved in cell wall biosynthesis